MFTPIARRSRSTPTAEVGMNMQACEGLLGIKGLGTGVGKMAHQADYIAGIGAVAFVCKTGLCVWKRYRGGRWGDAPNHAHRERAVEQTDRRIPA